MDCYHNYLDTDSNNCAGSPLHSINNNDTRSSSGEDSRGFFDIDVYKPVPYKTAKKPGYGKKPVKRTQVEGSH